MEKRTHRLEMELTCSSRVNLTAEKLQFIADYLSQAFPGFEVAIKERPDALELQDGLLKLNRVTARFNNNEVELIETLMKSNQHVALPDSNQRVTIHRLRKKLPPEYKIVASKRKGYTLVQA